MRETKEKLSYDLYYLKNRSFYGDGLFSFNGASGLNRNKTFYGNGLLNISGEAEKCLLKYFNSNGGIIFNGSAEIVFDTPDTQEFVYQGEGGLFLRGQSDFLTAKA